MDDNERDFSRVRFCVVRRGGFWFLLRVLVEALRCMMKASCAPVMEDVWLYQRRKLKRSRYLQELLNLYVQNILASAVHHCLG